MNRIKYLGSRLSALKAKLLGSKKEESSPSMPKPVQVQSSVQVINKQDPKVRSSVKVITKQDPKEKYHSFFY